MLECTVLQEDSMSQKRAPRGDWLVEVLESRRLLAATFYVSVHGNDANPGTDAHHAWRHIQQAMNVATPGSSVIVLPGTYNEKLTVRVSGDAMDGYITFQAGGHVVINGRGIAGADIINLNNQNYVQIIGFNIQNDLNVTDGSGIRMNGRDDHVNLLNNTIHNITGISAMGITVYGTDPATGITNIAVDGNQIFNCRSAPSEALTLNGNVSNFDVSNNYIHDINDVGIDLIGGEGMSPNPATDFARNGEVSGNRITRAHERNTNNNAAGILVDGGQSIVVERNVSWANDVGIEINAVRPGATASGDLVRDNAVYLNWGPGISVGASAAGEGTVTSSQATNNTLYHDNVRNLGSGELRLQWGSGNLIENNLVDGVHATVLMDAEYGSSGDVFDYNLYYCPGFAATAQFAFQGFTQSSLAAFRAASLQDANSIFANPLLLSPATARPRLNLHSPAINAGDPAFTGDAAETDLLGEPRLLGGRVDIGAVETA